MSTKDCYHEFVTIVDWPDGGCVEWCRECHRERYVTEDWDSCSWRYNGHDTIYQLEEDADVFANEMDNGTAERRKALAWDTVVFFRKKASEAFVAREQSRRAGDKVMFEIFDDQHLKVSRRYQDEIERYSRMCERNPKGERL